MIQQGDTVLGMRYETIDGWVSYHRRPWYPTEPIEERPVLVEVYDRVTVDRVSPEGKVITIGGEKYNDRGYQYGGYTRRNGYHKNRYEEIKFYPSEGAMYRARERRAAREEWGTACYDATSRDWNDPQGALGRAQVILDELFPGQVTDKEIEDRLLRAISDAYIELARNALARVASGADTGELRALTARLRPLAPAREERPVSSYSQEPEVDLPLFGSGSDG